MEPFLGEIRAFAFGAIPKDWLPCDGRELHIQRYVALYSLLGVRYGGDGSITFNLPDLRGRTPLCCAPGSMEVGLKEGTETVTLTAAQVPLHMHMVQATSAGATSAAPSGGALATLATGSNAYAAPAGMPLNNAAVSFSGGSAPHSNMQPSLAVNWCIATSGLYPQHP